MGSTVDNKKNKQTKQITIYIYVYIYNRTLSMVMSFNADIRLSVRRENPASVQMKM